MRFKVRLQSVLCAAVLLQPCTWLAASTISPSTASSAEDNDHGQKTEAAVIAADEGWSKAETMGDVQYIDHLLLPGYRSVNSNGTVHDKEAIIAGARKNHGTAEEAEKSAAQWQLEHPYKTSVIIQGDTAVVTFYLTSLGPTKGIMSCDIFVFVNGGWHAIYSQHSDAGK
jgi:hypothetical protein